MLMNQTNQTEEEGDSFSCYSPSVTGYHYFAVLWGCVVTVTGTAGNLMTVFAFASDSHLRTRFNVLIVNLAAADLLYCTLLQPISVDSYLHLRWRCGALWCRIFGLLLFLSNGVSIITLCLIAASRYLLVTRRAVFDRVFSDGGLVLLLTFTWGFGLVSFGPLWPVYVFVPQVCTCSFHRTRGRPYSSILLFFYFFVGLLCVGMFYLLIYRQVRISTRALLRYRISRRSSRKKPAPAVEGTDCSGVTGSWKVEWSSQADLSQTTDDNDAEKRVPPAATVVSKPIPTGIPQAPVLPTTTSSHSATPADSSDVKRVTRMCFIVFLCFVFCYMPFLLVNVFDKNNRAPQVLHMFCANLTWLNSCINPVLYAMMNRQFRQAYRVLLTRAAAPFNCLWARCQAHSDPEQ